MTEFLGVPLRPLRLCGGELQVGSGRPTPIEKRSAFDAAATVAHQPVHLRIGRLVVDAELMRAFGGDTAALVMHLQTDIAARLGDRSGAALAAEPTRPQADRRAELVGPIGAAVASQVLPHLLIDEGR